MKEGKLAVISWQLAKSAIRKLQIANCKLQIVIFLLIIGSSLHVSAQDEKELNLPKYDKATFQFGFTLGLNSANLIINRVPDFKYIDTVYNVQSVSQSGFNLGISVTKQFGSLFDLRFAPTLSFVERDLQYTLTYLDTGQLGVVTAYQTIQLQSTYLEFPLDFKFKSKRLNNFRMYVLGGGKYAIDMLSQSQVNDQLAGNKVLIKLERIDYGYNVGLGFDFFMDYFKFGVELKMYTGIPNLYVKDETNPYAASLTGLYNKTFLISLFFEGNKN